VERCAALVHLKAISTGADRDRYCVCGLLFKKNTRRTKLTGSFTGSWLFLR